MKLTNDHVSANDTRMPTLRFSEEASLSRFGGVPVLRHLFQALKLRERFEEAVGTGREEFSRGGVLLFLLVMLLLGFRRLSDVQWLERDALVRRLLGWARLPSKATLSRTLSSMTPMGVARLRSLSSSLVLEAVRRRAPSSVTVDFDGSVQSTHGRAEGTAVGFNKKKKGARSYMPLFATLDGVGFSFFLDMLHRPGNVHDSRGAESFIEKQLGIVRDWLPGVRLDSRMDAAFFDHKLLGRIHEQGVLFTCSVPFNRLSALKKLVRGCSDWQTASGARAGQDTRWSYAETTYQPKSWSKAGRDFRFILVRQHKPKQRKGPLQLDLFEPRDMEYEYSVVVTNDQIHAAASLVEHHHGRGRQEKLFGDAKQDVALGHIACRTLTGNQTFTLVSIIAHNIGRILERHVPPSTTAHGALRRVQTIRRRLLELPAKLTFPQHKPVVTIHAAPEAHADIASTIESIQKWAA